MTTGPWVCRVNAARGAGWGVEPAGCRAHELLQPPGAGRGTPHVSPLLLSSCSSSSLWRPTFSSSWLSLSSSLLSCWLFSFSCTRSCGDSEDERGPGAQQMRQERQTQAHLRAEQSSSRVTAGSGVLRAEWVVLCGQLTPGMS